MCIPSPTETWTQMWGRYLFHKASLEENRWITHCDLWTYLCTFCVFVCCVCAFFSYVLFDLCNDLWTLQNHCWSIKWMLWRSHWHWPATFSCQEFRAVLAVSCNVKAHESIERDKNRMMLSRLCFVWSSEKFSCRYLPLAFLREWEPRHVALSHTRNSGWKVNFPHMVIRFVSENQAGLISYTTGVVRWSPNRHSSTLLDLQIVLRFLGGHSVDILSESRCIKFLAG